MHGYYYFINNSFNGLVEYSKKIEKYFDNMFAKVKTIY